MTTTTRHEGIINLEETHTATSTFSLEERSENFPHALSDEKLRVNKLFILASGPPLDKR
jgi:hypothetical protein